jgi:hypothetical protein
MISRKSRLKTRLICRADPTARLETQRRRCAFIGMPTSCRQPRSAEHRHRSSRCLLSRERCRDFAIRSPD